MTYHGDFFNHASFSSQLAEIGFRRSARSNSLHACLVQIDKQSNSVSIDCQENNKKIGALMRVSMLNMKCCIKNNINTRRKTQEVTAKKQSGP